MNKGSIMKGVSVGLTAGAVVYAISSASRSDKRRLKSRTGKLFVPSVMLWTAYP